jgi:aminotransferase
LRLSKRALATRTEGFTESVIREMTRLCATYGGINLAQGFPNFPAPDLLKDAAKRAIDADINQYAITWGSKTLRDALTTSYAETYGMTVDPETMLTVTCGSTEAMVSTLLAIVDPGDEVVVLEPFYENYGPDAAICGARPVFVPLRAPEYTFDRDELRAAFSARTKAIIVNTPNNPSGRIFSRGSGHASSSGAKRDRTSSENVLKSVPARASAINPRRWHGCPSRSNGTTHANPPGARSRPR